MKAWARTLGFRQLFTKGILGENLLYTFVWGGIYIVPFLHSGMMAESFNINNLIVACLKITPFFIVFLIHNLFISRLLFKMKYIWYLFLTTMLIITMFGCVELYQQFNEGKIFVGIAAARGYSRIMGASLTDYQWYWNILLASAMLAANIAIKLFYKSIDDERKYEIVRRQSLQAEMDYLKYQINPHFFMNTLNNIHALIDIDTESAKENIIELSKMMRYVLYDSSSPQISLHNEMQFVSNYINLMRIRYTKDIDIRFNYPRNEGMNISIPPLLLIVFVENAFKHGISYNKPSFIHINVKKEPLNLRCTIRNSRHGDSNQGKGGIGLDNVRKRLDMLYGANYSLVTDTTNPEEYNVELIIPCR
jgi:sensor histidine kinase YesM